ncbi:MAG: protein kinase [Planctomycetaceae bacterium]
MKDLSRQIDGVIAEYLRAAETGTPADRRRLLNEHPQLKSGLQSFFDSYDRMDSVVEPDRTALFQPGEHVGRYQLVRTIGEGAFGQVWLGFDTELKRTVAIKVPNAARLRDRGQSEAFLAEARLVAGMEHPGIVPIYDVGRAQNRCVYLVSRYIAGTDLGAAMEHQRLPFDEAARIASTVASALEYAHSRKLVHRDIKPSNILLELSDRTPYVTDFGLAILGSETPEGRRLAGTPAYMSPEQVRCDEAHLDHRSDIFSLGVVLYQMLTGQKPFNGSSAVDVMKAVTETTPPAPRAVDPDIPEWLEAVCLRAIEKNPSRRFATAGEMAAELGHHDRSPKQKDRTPTTVIASAGMFESETAELSSSLSTGHPARNPAGTGTRWKTRPVLIAGVALAAVTGYAFGPMKLFRPDTAADARQDAGTSTADISPAVVDPTNAFQSSDAEHRIAARVLSLGGTVDVTDGIESKEIGRLDEIPAGRIGLTWIMMPKNERVNDELIREFRGLDKLIGVDFFRTAISNRTAAELATWKSLTHVYLHQDRTVNSITDDGILELAKLPKLQQLVISGDDITDAGLAGFAGNRTLEWLDISHTPVTDDGLRSLSDVRFLSTLDIGGTAVTDAGLAHLVSLTHLQTLCVDETRVTGNGLRLFDNHSLKRLQLSGDRIDDATVAHLRQQHPDCILQID